MPDAVVIGTSPSGRLAAHLLARSGRSVVLFDRSSPPVAPEIPTDTGLVVAPGSPVLGALVPFQPTRAVVLRGRVHPLPLSPASLAAAVPLASWPAVSVGRGEARVRGELSALLGGGTEQRTYRDWVVQRFGAPAFAQIFEAYAARRFGPAEQIVCGVATLHHGPAGHAEWLAPSRPFVADLAGVEVRTDAIRAVGSGFVDAEAGRVEGLVVVDAPPAQLHAWLGADPALTRDVGLLLARHGVEVLLPLEADLPLETHLLDPDVPFFRITRPGLLPGVGDPQLAVLHLALDREDPLWTGPDAAMVQACVASLDRLKIGPARADRAIVRRLPDHHPMWRLGHLARMRAWLHHLDDHDILPVGRAAVAAPLDIGGQAAWLEALLGPERPTLRELARVQIEPPTRDPVERARLRDLIVA